MTGVRSWFSQQALVDKSPFQKDAHTAHVSTGVCLLAHGNVNLKHWL